MRTALVHDWFQGYHGAERTVAAMLDLFARDPDIFTFHAAHELLPPRLVSAIVRESRLGALPGVRQRGHDPGRWRWLLPYMPRFFEQPRPVRVRARAELLPRLRRRRRTPAGRTARLLLPHARCATSGCRPPSRTG